MGPFRELIAIDHRQALEFFTVRLQDISEPDVDREELLYNASVLAHYAQTSIYADTDLGTPANLSAVFDNFVCDSTLINDGEIYKLYDKWFKSPLPPKGINMNMQMGHLLRDFFRFPTDKVGDE